MLKNIRNGIQFGIGFIFIILLSGISIAAYNSLSSVYSGDILTKDSWNQMIINQEDLNSRIDSISNNTIGTGSFVRVIATAVIGSSSTNTWTATTTCPEGYTIINWGAEQSIQYWGGGMSHWYAKCIQDGNGVKASLYTQNGYTGHKHSCFGLCIKD